MALMKRARWFLLTVAAIAIVAVVLATRRSDDAPPGSAPSARESDVATPTSPHPARRVAATPQVAPSDAPATDDAIVPDKEDDGFPAIDVEVVWADGTPAKRAPVYALHAGAAGRDGFESGPHATTRATTDEFASTPSMFRVPATVHVDLSHRYFAALTIDIDPADRASVAPDLLLARLEPGLDPGGSTRGNFVNVRVWRVPVVMSPLLHRAPRVEVGASHGTVRWKGEGVVAGQADFDGFAPDVENVLAIKCRLDGTPLPEAPNLPVRVRSGVNEPASAPGGFLHVVMEAMPPDGVGDVTVERADGTMLVVNGLPSRAADVRHGRFIGPLSPGDFELVVRIAGDDVTRVHATVAAGGSSFVTIPRLSPR